jgi:predicted hydrocarbon binding protein
MRKISRLRSTASQRRRQIMDMIRWGLSPTEMYDEGQRDGREIRARSLTDVLVCVKECGLGSASILEESNRHVTFRVLHSLCRQIEGVSDPEGKKCFYLAGFVAGAIASIGGDRKIFVRELTCGGSNSSSCMFIASW